MFAEVHEFTRIAMNGHEFNPFMSIRFHLCKFMPIELLAVVLIASLASCGYSFVGRSGISSVKIEFPSNETEWRNFEPILMKYLVSEVTARGIKPDENSPYRLRITLEMVKPSVAVPGNLDQPLVGSVDVRVGYVLSYSTGAVIRSGSATASSSFSNEIARTFDDSMAETLQSIARQVAAALE